MRTGSSVSLLDTVKLVHQIREAGHRIYAMGNGGSAANAEHLVTDLVKLGYRAFSLTSNTALLTAIANDHGYERVYADQVDVFVEPGDLVIGFSTSGESKNVILAIAVAKALGATTLAVTGYSGGGLAEKADLVVYTDQDVSTGKTEDVHLASIHALVRNL